jgi:hypothetical protein
MFELRLLLCAQGDKILLRFPGPLLANGLEIPANGCLANAQVVGNLLL